MGLNVYVSEVYEQLNGMTAALYRTIDKLSDYLSSVEDFVNDTVLKGVSYDSMKTYFGEVHAPWAKGMIAACEAMIEANNSYINAFVEMVDASGTDIIEEDIRYMMMKLSHSINNFQAIDQAAGEEVVDTLHLEQLEAEHQRLLERLYDFDSSTADYYNYAQSLIEAAKQGGSLMGNSWDASTSTFLNPAMLNMEWRPLVDSAWEKLSEEYILFRGKYVHARRKLEQYWNRQDGYFEGFWWQDIEKMKEAYRMLDLEIAQKGGIKIHDLITSEYVEDQLKMYALQSLSNAPRTGTYDLEFLHSLENMYLKAGLDYSEMDHTINKKGLEALKECYKNIKLKKSGDWLERGGGDIIAGVTLIAGGMVMSRAGNRSLKIRSEGIGNTGSGKTYSVKRGPKLQGEGLSSKGAGGASFHGNGRYNVNKGLSIKGSKVNNLPKWTRPDGSTMWPPNNGAVKGTEEIITMKPGIEVGRIGKGTGKYVAPPRTSPEKLSLKPGTDTSMYNEYKIVREIPGVEKAKIAPWFGQPGGGTQYKLPKSIDILLEEGYIELIIK
jgi:hypothetical protein